MKSKFIITIACAMLAMTAAYAAPAEIKAKAGDNIYICGCGKKCGCESVSVKEGKCNCGHDLKKVTLTKVEGKRGFYESEGKQMTAKLSGKYSCACGADCCQMISQKPGKCTCGKELAKVEDKK